MMNKSSDVSKRKTEDDGGLLTLELSFLNREKAIAEAAGCKESWVE